MLKNKCQRVLMLKEINVNSNKCYKEQNVAKYKLYKVLNSKNTKC